MNAYAHQLPPPLPPGAHGQPPAPPSEPAITPTERPASAHERGLVQAYAEAHAAVRAWKARLSECRAELLAAMGQHKRIRWTDGNALRVDMPGRQRLDTKALLLARPDLAPVLAQFTTTGRPSVQLRIKG
jgi:hypothetical protein